jgi:hypothetical protein
MKKSGVIAAAMAIAAMGNAALNYPSSGGNGGGHWVKSNMTAKQKKARRKSMASKKARKRNRK